MHLIFANIFVGAKHSGSKSLVIINKLSAKMLRPSKSDRVSLFSRSGLGLVRAIMPFPTQNNIVGKRHCRLLISAKLPSLDIKCDQVYLFSRSGLGLVRAIMPFLTQNNIVGKRHCCLLISAKLPSLDIKCDRVYLFSRSGLGLGRVISPGRTDKVTLSLRVFLAKQQGI